MKQVLLVGTHILMTLSAGALCLATVLNLTMALKEEYLLAVIFLICGVFMMVSSGVALLDNSKGA